jgi:hypothetical protein
MDVKIISVNKGWIEGQINNYNFRFSSQLSFSNNKLPDLISLVVINTHKEIIAEYSDTIEFKKECLPEYKEIFDELINIVKKYDYKPFIKDDMYQKVLKLPQNLDLKIAYRNSACSEMKILDIYKVEKRFCFELMVFENQVDSEILKNENLIKYNLKDFIKDGLAHWGLEDLRIILRNGESSKKRSPLEIHDIIVKNDLVILDL